MTRQAGFTPVAIILSVLILAALGSVAYYFSQHQSVPAAQPKITVSPTPQPTSDTAANWKTYTNIEYSYSIHYPPDQAVQEIEDVNSDIRYSQCVEVGRVITNDPAFYAPQLYIEAITSPVEGSCYGNDIYTAYGKYEEWRKKLDAMKIGDVITPVKNEVITRKKDININRNTAEVFELTTSKWIERMITVNHNQILYVIGGYNPDKKFDQILFTFKFL